MCKPFNYPHSTPSAVRSEISSGISALHCFPEPLPEKEVEEKYGKNLEDAYLSERDGMVAHAVEHFHAAYDHLNKFDRVPNLTGGNPFIPSANDIYIMRCCLNMWRVCHWGEDVGRFSKFEAAARAAGGRDKLTWNMKGRMARIWVCCHHVLHEVLWDPENENLYDMEKEEVYVEPEV
jgi:hypothetical protein